MNATQLHAELSKLEAQQDRDRTERQECRERLDELLRVEPVRWNPTGQERAELRDRIARFDREIAELEARAEALRGMLPSEEEVAAARKKAAALRRRLGREARKFETAWSGLMAALDAAEGPAREAAAARVAAEAAQAELLGLNERFALDLGVPPEVVAANPQARLAAGIVALIRAVVTGGGVSPQLDSHLAALRRFAERAAA